MTKCSRLAIVASAALAVCALAACATTALSPGDQLEAAKILYGGEVAVDFAAVTLTAVAKGGAFNAAASAKLHTDVQTAAAILQVGRASYAGANAGGIVIQVAALGAVIADIETVVHPGPSAPAASGSTPAAAPDVETMLLGAVTVFATDEGLTATAKATLASSDLPTLQAAIAAQQPRTDADVAACLAALSPAAVPAPAG